MKVLLSTYTLKYPVTGIGWYTHYLHKGLQAHSAINQLVCLPVLSASHAYAKKKKYFQTKIKKLIRSWVGSYQGLNYYRNYRFNKKTRFLSQKNFIYHEPCYILRPYSGLKVCSVHDLSHLHYPQHHPPERVKFLLRYLDSSLKNSDHIITGSYFIRNEIIDYFKISAEKVTAVYHGVSPIFKPRQAITCNAVLERYGLLGKSYLLSVATLEPRKNLMRLIQAFSQLSERQRKQHPLVLVGVKEKFTYKMENLMNKLLRKQELYCLGYVSACDLPYLYSAAYACAYISLYEGFGLPLLEAFASGIPTLTSDTSSMPEIAADAALLVNPCDIASITEKLYRVLNDQWLRHELKQKSLIQAKKFSWEKCIDNTVGVYKQVFDSSKMDKVS